MNNTIEAIRLLMKTLTPIERAEVVNDYASNVVRVDVNRFVQLEEAEKELQDIKDFAYSKCSDDDVKETVLRQVEQMFKEWSDDYEKIKRMRAVVAAAIEHVDKVDAPADSSCTLDTLDKLITIVRAYQNFSVVSRDHKPQIKTSSAFVGPFCTWCGSVEHIGLNCLNRKGKLSKSQFEDYDYDDNDDNDVKYCKTHKDIVLKDFDFCYKCSGRKMSAKEAEAQGYTIDRSAAGCWYAYKGPRFQPIEGFEVETENETYWREQYEKYISKKG